MIVTNSPIADGTVFIARTGNQDQKMVVLREEYYRKLVEHIQHELKFAQLKEQRLGLHTRSTSYNTRPLIKTARSSNSIKALPANLGKPPIQRASSLRALRTVERQAYTGEQEHSEKRKVALQS